MKRKYEGFITVDGEKIHVVMTESDHIDAENRLREIEKRVAIPPGLVAIVLDCAKEFGKTLFEIELKKPHEKMCANAGAFLRRKLLNYINYRED